MDTTWMAQAIEAASGARPHPNPRVGAIVLDRNGRLVGQGIHAGVGQPHAEDLALRAAGPGSRGGTLYVTLEPCVHHGHTPPCVDQIIRSEVVRVVIGVLDPDLRVAGRGVEALRRAGLRVVTGMLSDEIEARDAAYFHHRRTGRPLVTLKAALTLDGQLAARNGSSQWITGPEARRDAHLLRSASDAIMIGAGTLRADDPRLTVRLEDHAGPQPTPIVVAGLQPLPESAQLLTRDDLIVISPVDRPELGDRVMVVPDEDHVQVDLAAAIELLGKKGLLAVLVEGGSRLFASLVRNGLADRLVLYYGSRLAGGSGRPFLYGGFDTMSASTAWRIKDATRVGGDLRVEAVPGSS